MTVGNANAAGLCQLAHLFTCKQEIDVEFVCKINYYSSSRSFALNKMHVGSAKISLLNTVNALSKAIKIFI